MALRTATARSGFPIAPNAQKATLLLSPVGGQRTETYELAWGELQRATAEEALLERLERLGFGVQDGRYEDTELQEQIALKMFQTVLQTLRREGVAGASAFHAAACFLGRNTVHTAGLVEAGGNVPVVVIFADFEEHVSRVLPKLFGLVPHRLIVRENVSIEQDALD